MHRNLISAGLVGCIAALSACGGGGGAPAPAVPTSPATVNAANAASVSSEAYKGGDTLASGGDLSGSAVGAVVAPSGASFSLVRFTSDKLRWLASLEAAPLQVVTGAVTTITRQCPGGGTSARTFDDKDNNNRLSTGDTVSVIFTNCVEGTDRVNGSFSLDNVTVTGRPGIDTAWNAGVTATFGNLAVTSGGTLLGSVNGGFNLALTTTDGNNITHTINGTSLTATEGSNTRTLTGFTATLELRRSPPAYSYTSSGTLASSRLGGTLTYQTPTPFAGVGTDFPSSGRLLVTGANNAGVRFTAVGSTVTLEVDANGDGAYETSFNRTWAELIAS
ncbi:MAG: hypothetical protein WA210_05925 [Burkholderiaceae bacterium]